MKKVLRKMILTILVIALLPIYSMNVFANTSGQYDIYTYILHSATDGSGNSVKWVEISGHTQYISGELIIPDIINGFPVYEIAPNAFSNQGITSLSIPSGVSVIGENAFADCHLLTEVIVRSGKSGYLTLEEKSFSCCYSMESITLPRKTGYVIQDMAFISCSSLKDIFFNGTKEQYDECSISVYDYNDYFNDAEVFYVDSVREINLNKTSLSLIKNNSEKLIPTLTPSNATNRNVLWSSSDESVAVVSADGTVKGIGVGTATITAKTEDKNRIATCIVSVTENVNEEILGGGDGTELNPYKIDSEEELQIVSDIPNAHYILERDIELTETFVPLCTLEDEFSGTFDGNNHTISNVTIADFCEYSGLFGKSSGTIKNLNVIYSSQGVNCNFSKDVFFGGIVGYNDGSIINCTIDLSGNVKESHTSGYATRVGGIAGQNDVNGKIENCNVSGEIAVTVTSDSDDVSSLYIGGISGTNLNTIDSCNIELSITQSVVVDGYLSVDSYIGGISASSKGAIKNSKAVYNVTVGNASHAYIGGIIGVGSDFTIENVSTDGRINSTANYVYAGGIVGKDLSSNKGTITKADSKITAEASNIFGATYIGGIAGYLESSSIVESCAIIDFDVTNSTEYVARPVLHCGGLVGTTSGQINNCFAIGSVTSNLITTNVYSGGLVGGISGVTPKISNSYAAVSGVKYGLSYPGGNVTNSFYDRTVSGCSDTEYGSPTSTISMKMKTIYSNAGWDFDNVWSISSSINGGYPYLKNVESLLDLSLEIAETSSRWYFDISKDTYTENAIIYVGIYDEHDKLLTVGLENMVENDITSIAIQKVDNYSYAKVFEWVNNEPITNSKVISLE